MLNATYLKKTLAWVDYHGMFALSLFLLLFIPLYPKIPLLEAIPGYLVRVRLEDVGVGLVGFFWLVQMIRRKIATTWPVALLVAGYATVGFLSLVIAVGLQQTVPAQLLHVGKSVLHYARYLEYFSLFFFLHSGIKNKKHFQIAIGAVLASVIAITVYGFGQRYWQWPVFSTMNREYSKGTALTLSESARIHSTFGGHYDLAAYLVIILPIVFSIFLIVPNKKSKVITGIIAATGSWLLLASAQKTSLLAFIAAAAVIWFQFLSKKLGWPKTILITVGTTAIGTVLLLIFLNTIGGRYAEKITNLLAGKPSDLPQDFVAGQLDENWSENAKKYGLSMGIRLDTLWPQALYGFSTNPWTGKGYATLNKQGISEFTEADSTDNNYLRTLGETGLLGSLFFFGILYYIWRKIRHQPSTDPLIQAVVLGYIAGLIGMLVNAASIDVFAASKVAFSFWGITGIVLAATQLNREKQSFKEDQETIREWLHNIQLQLPLFFTLTILVLLAHKQPFSEYGPIQGFSFSQSTAINVQTASCLSQSASKCSELLTQIPISAYPYVLYLVPWYVLFNLPAMYYFANFVLVILGLILCHKFLLKIKTSSIIRVVILLLLVTPIINQQIISTASPLNIIILLLGLTVSWLSHQKLTKAIGKQIQLQVDSHPEFTKVVGVVASSLLLIMITQGQAASTIINNFRDRYDVHHFRAVRRMNDFMKNNTNPQDSAIMLTFLDPYYISLFNQDQYSVLAPPTMQTLDEYRTLLLNRATLYFSNAANEIQNTVSLNSTLRIADQFGLELKSIDCEHRCNIYQVTNQPTQLTTTVQAANQASFSAKTEYQIVIASNQIARFFNPNNYLPATTQIYRDFLTQPEFDGFVFIGNSADKVEENHGQFFRDQFIDQSNVPILYSIGNHTVSMYANYGPGQQRFILQKTMTLILDDNVSDHPADQQRLLIDTLLQLYQHPEITDLVIVSNTFGWADSLTNSDKKSIQQLTAALNLNWHIISAKDNSKQTSSDDFAFIDDKVTTHTSYLDSEPINRVQILTIYENEVKLDEAVINPDVK